MNKFKLHFSNPVILIEGNSSRMCITATIIKYTKHNKFIFNLKRFSKRITLHKNDKCDLNKAKNILQASLEQKAYIWAKKCIDTYIKKEQDNLNIMKAFSEKADYIIKHDNDYINKLMI